ncbi:MAG: hybrid sensor histidine kinase/response regulator [Bacteroidales bacterium]|nr:hybrid sensor histidine kinase/response regulator [Bacteroidales bacterium]
MNDSFHDTPNILIVDDIPANLKLLGAILKNEGYKVRPVPSGSLALQAAEKEKPSLILLDIMMPDMNGYEVCEKLKENPELSDIPVIFISALNDTSDIVKALTSGGVDFITKPFQAEEVKARVSTHLKLRQQSKELEELNSTKDKFFSIIAHDLRNPFSVLLGMSDLLLSNYDSYDDETRLELISIQNETTKQTFKLLENLLEWAKIQRSSFDFVKQKLNLKELVELNIAHHKEISKQKEIALTHSINDTISIQTDSNMVQTVLRNLIMNAIKFSNIGGSIVISAREEEEFIEISITDNGVGISPENLQKLFKIENSITTKGTANEKGTGLGLMLCKEFVEKQGGRIWVESEMGKGSSFKFTTPKSL